MSAVPEVALGQVWEYGHPGPRLKVVLLAEGDLILMQGIPHEAAPKDREPIRMWSDKSKFRNGPWRFIEAAPEARRVRKLKGKV